jgi:hypothetical protein
MSRPDRPGERVRQRLPDVSRHNRGGLGVPGLANDRRQNDADTNKINNNDQGEQKSHVRVSECQVRSKRLRSRCCSNSLGSWLRNHCFEHALQLLSNEEDFIRRIIIGLSALAFAALPTLAFADGDGALTGAAGGAVAGAVVGGPVGAAVGGLAGGVIGGAASGPGTVVVAPGPAPCNTRTTTTQDNNTGASVTRQTTNCPD